MNTAITVLQIVTPVFLVAGLGFAWVRMGFEYQVDFVTRLAMNLAIPALVFVSLMQSEAEPRSLVAISLAAVVTYFAVLAVAGLVLLALRLPVRTYLSPIFMGNTGNLGIPLSLFAFGEAGLGYAIAVFAVSTVLLLTIGVMLVAERGSGARALREPMVWSSLLGALFLWQGWETPQVVTRTLELLGQLAVPLMLLTLGVAVARLNPARLGPALGLSAIKLIICVVAAWGVGLAFGLADVAFGVLVLQMSTPVAVTSFLIAQRYDAQPEEVAGLVFASTLLSVMALPLVLSLLVA